MKTVLDTVSGSNHAIVANTASLPKRTLDPLTKWSESKQIRGQL